MAVFSSIKRDLKKSLILKLMLFAFIIYFAFAGFYKLNYLPGLHGDEAWIGIKANSFNQFGIHQIRGMNTYTGILQILISQLVFKVWGIGVFQLRAGTVVLNILTFLTIIFYLIKQKQSGSAIFYMLILAQSSLILAFYRVAWEVNTLTHFFLATSFILLKSINKNSRWNFWYFFLFLLVNILASYNHIIFSCAPIAGFFALIIWKLNTGGKTYDHIAWLLCINLMNIVGIFLIMNYCNYPIGENLLLSLSMLLIIVLIEIWSVQYLTKQIPFEIPKIMILDLPIKAFLTIGILIFVFFHGIAFASVLANYKILLEVYSFEQSTFYKIVFVINAVILAVYFSHCLYRVFNKQNVPFFAFFIIVYLCLFNLYTRNTSYRYYLEFYFIFTFFVATNLAVKTNRLVTLSLLLTFSITVHTFCVIFFFNRPLKAIRFVRSPGQVETSAHFLPKEPLLDFIKKNNIGYITSLTDNSFFITQPLEFYNLVKERPDTASRSVLIMYDYKHYGSGFQFVKSNNAP
ncbi:MAG: hypothetical protein V4553_16225 [Bacteroidota bacterium]